MSVTPNLNWDELLPGPVVSTTMPKPARQFAYSRLALLNLDHIPVELKARDQWIVWREDPPESPAAKPKKTPLCPRTLQGKGWNDPQNWTSYDKAVEVYSQNPTLTGIGFVFSMDDPYVGIDLDNCRNPETGLVFAWAQEQLQRFNSYTEISPSQTGVKILVRGSLAGKENHFTVEGHEVEIYETGRYFALTGQQLLGTSDKIRDCQAEINLLPNEPPQTPPDLVIPRAEDELAPVVDAIPDDELVVKIQRSAQGEKFKQLMGGSTSGYAGYFAASGALCTILAFWTRCNPGCIDRIYRTSGLFEESWWDARVYSGNRSRAEVTIASSCALAAAGDMYKPSAKPQAEVNKPHIGAAANPTVKAKPSQKSAENPLAKDTTRTATLTRGDGVKVRKVPWLWKGRLVAEGLNGFSGEPGCGKSTMGADIIAHVTRGLDFPDGAVNTNGPKDVLIICDEDGREDTIVPRLMLAGADMTHVWFMDIEIHKGQTVEQAGTRLDEDLPLIEQKLCEHPEIVLIVPDPVTEYFGDANPNSDQEVGPIYSKMLQVSKRCHVAWLLISHFNKDRQATSTNRNSGAKVMVTRPRCNWLFAGDPHSTDDRFLMLRGKCNLATNKTMAFYIGTQNVALDVDGESLTLENITHIRWDGETDDKADDVLLCMADPKDHASTKVKAFLDDLLAEGPVRAKAAYDAGIAQRINPDMFHKYGRGISRSQIPTAADGTNEWWWARTKLELDDLRARTVSKQPAADTASDDGVLTFLQGMVGDATMPVSVLKSAAKARGLNWEAVRKAHQRHGYESASTEQGRCWRKRLSADNTPVPEKGENEHAL